MLRSPQSERAADVLLGQPKLSVHVFLSFFLSFLIFIWLHWVLVVACLIFCCSMWDLVPQSEIEPTPTACRVLATAPPGKSLPMFLIREAPRVVPAQRKGQTPELRSS